ncbi:tetratricopeptide repeat protein [Streptomyces sp. SCSIO 30461]|uniref:tetratricopeptide repeat protein n=1 Tax=Streptomyces sp. SCSIO 30461 TaxID=3118085 RepID=UPI0030CD7514
MRRTHATTVLAISTSLLSVLLSVLLAIAVNVATGGTLPDALVPLSPYAWWLVGLLTLATAVGAVRAHRAVPAATAPEDSPAVPPAAEPDELPPPIADFAGRADEVGKLLRLVDAGHRAIAITGAPGLGKSTLAIRLAHELGPRFPDGRLYADLGAGRGTPATSAAVLARLLEAIGAPVEERSGDIAALAARFRNRTARRRVLLLLDDAADAAQIRPLLPGGDGCLALITSRKALDGVPEATPLALGGLGDSEALALLAAVAGQDRVDVEPEAALQVVRACGLLPLAVRIAAARLRSRPGWPVSELAARLADERHRLDMLHLDDLAVRAVFEACYAALEPADRALFRSLGAHPGPRVTVRVAAAAAGRDPHAARSALERLTDAQLLACTGPDAYRLHDLVRLFAAERLERDTDPAERRAVLARLIAAHTEDATEHGSHAWGGAQQSTVSLLVRAAVREGLHTEGFRLALAADRWLWDQPSQLPRLAMWTSILDTARRLGEQRVSACAMRGMGAAYLHEGRYDQAVDHLRMSVAIQRHTGTRPEQIKTRRLLGDALRHAGRYDQALAEYRTVLNAYRELGRAMGEAEVLSSLGALHLDRRRPDEAIVCLEPAVAALVRRGGSPAYPADAQRNLGAAYVQTGDLTRAEHSLRAALALYRQHDRPVGEGWTLRELGRLEERRGALSDGAAHHRAALAVFDEAGYGVGVAALTETIGDNFLAQGDVPAADTHYRRAAEVYADLGYPVREAEVRRKLSLR